MNPYHVTSDRSQLVINSFSELGLHQISNTMNNFGNVLDLIFTNICDDFSILPAGNAIKVDSAAHKSLELTVTCADTNDDETNNLHEWYFDYNNADYENFNAEFALVDCTGLFVDLDVNICVEIFYEKLYTAIQEYVPFKKRRCKTNAPWMTPEVKNLRNRKNRAYKKYRDSGAFEDFNQYDMTFYVASFTQRTTKHIISTSRT